MEQQSVTVKQQQPKTQPIKSPQKSKNNQVTPKIIKQMKLPLEKFLS